MNPLDAVGRSLGDADLLRPADSEVEAALVESAERWIDQVSAGFSTLGQANVPFAVEVDCEGLLGELSTLAWSGAGTFEVISADPRTAPPSVSLAGPLSFADLLRSPDSVMARNVQSFLPSVARLHDQVTAAWGAACSVSVLMTTGSIDIATAGRSLVIVVTGRARVGSDTDDELGPGEAKLVPAGTVAIAATEPAVLLQLDVKTFGPEAVVRQLRRSVEHLPAFRADLPRRPAEPYTSYAGSPLDVPDGIRAAALAVYDDGVPLQAQCWWNSSLAFARGRLDTYAHPGNWVLRWPAPPSFGDRRLAWTGRDELVLAAAGHVVAIAPDLYDDLLDLARGGSTTVDAPLGRVFGGLGLLVPS